MKKNNKINYIIISLMMLCVGFLLGSYKKEKSIVYDKSIKNIFEFQLMEDERYGIVYDTNDRCSYLVKISSNGFDQEMYFLGEGIFVFGEYDENSIVVFNEEKEYLFNENVTMKDSNQKIEELCTVKLTYNRKDNTINVMSYKNNALCKIPIAQSAEYVVVDIIDLAR